MRPSMQPYVSILQPYASYSRCVATASFYATGLLPTRCSSRK